MKKQLLALMLVCFMLVSMITGCGSTAASSAASASTSAPEASAEETSEAEPAAATESEPAAETSAAEETASDVTVGYTGAEVGGSYEVALPIADEVITLNWYTDDIGYLWSMLDDISENVTLQELESRTNIHLNWTFCGYDDNAASLMIASGDWADVMDNAEGAYPGGIAQGVADGVFLDLTDDIEQYMPNYKAVIDADPTLTRDLSTPDGRMYSITKVTPDAPIMWGMFIRSDWTEAAGIEASTIDTYDELENAMLAIKDDHPEMTQILRLLGTGTEIYGGLTYGYGVNGSLWSTANDYPLYAEDGTMAFATTQDGFKDYLKMMNKWYEEGLITSDFVSITDRDMFDAGEATGEYGVFYANISHVTNLYSQATEEGYELTPLSEPTVNEGDELHFSGSTYNNGGNGVAIFSTTPYEKEICEFIDYLFSNEGAVLMNYGIEGKSYELDDNGNIQLNMDYFSDCPDMPRAGGYNDVRTGMLGVGVYTCLVDYWGFYDNFYSEVQLATQDAWAERTPATLQESWEVPSAITNYMSSDDNTTANTYLSDISTYIEEMVPAFILGQKDIDAEWDEFVNSQYNMGLQEVLDIYQAAYDSYWS